MAAPGYLYVAHLSTGDVKIGRASDPETRLRQHARSAAMFRASLVETWVSAHVADTADAELGLIHRIELRGARALPLTRETFEGLDYATIRVIAEAVVCEALTREAEGDTLAVA